jgi:hypothetical protein
VADEVAELAVRDLGDQRAARAAQQAATRRLCEIARLGRSVDIHLVCSNQRPHAEAVPGQLKTALVGTVAFRVRAAVNSFILLDSEKALLLPPRLDRAVVTHETVEEARRSTARSTRAASCRSRGRVPGAAHPPLALSHSGGKIRADFGWVEDP